MRLNADRRRRQRQQLNVFLVSDDCFSVVYRTVHNRLVLLFLEDSRNNRLSHDTVPSVLDNYRSQRIEPVDVSAEVGLHTLEVVDESHVSCGVPSDILVMISDVEAHRKENVVPDEHL